MKKTPYDYLPSWYIDRPELFEYLKESPRTDYIITILIDDVMQNELLQWDWEDDTWVWANDWYEGQDNVTWVGIISIEDAYTHTPLAGDTKYV